MVSLLIFVDIIVEEEAYLEYIDLFIKSKRKYNYTLLI